jgi:hypothetical protein
MTDTTLAPSRVRLTDTDLLEAGIVALESGAYQQCHGRLRNALGSEQPMHCAEGVFAELLVRAYPERFSWTIAGLLYDSVAMHTYSVLTGGHWDLMHPYGGTIQSRAARKLRHDTLRIAAANDLGGVTFPEIAAALRRARAEVEREYAGGPF